ncbi:QDE2 protein [Coleophoma crateriformis]|uniref:QDE2 protein n=1 Tax=Coleophoma crateriformis TaxID=565419 RepID=A0A3D8T785_9HELO|nr:QDE2 protein [Coleophoma crateriformis]
MSFSGFDNRGRGRGRGGPRGGEGGGRGGGGRGGGGDRGGGGGDRGFRGGRGGGGRGGRGGFAAPIQVFSDPNSIITPDANITKIEDDYMTSTAGIGALKLTASFPPRPGHGTLGQKLTVFTNYFELKSVQDLNLTRYNVEVSPQATGKKLKRVFELLLENPEFDGVASEFKSLIISRHPLNISDPYVTEIRYLPEGQDEPKTNAQVYRVRVVTPTTLAVSDMVNYLRATSNTSPVFAQKHEVIQGLNALMGHSANIRPNITSIGQNRHFTILPRDPSNSHPLGGGLESLRGFVQSVRAATGRMLINVNVSHGIFLQPGLLSNLYPQLGFGARHKLETKIKRIRVALTHLPGSKDKKTNLVIPRVKTIFGLASVNDGSGSPNPPRVSSFAAGPKDVKFWLSDVPLSAPKGTKPPTKKKQPSTTNLPNNAYVSVYDYFKHKYPKIVLNERNPVVNVGNRENPSYLPAEVCKVLEGQTIKRRLSPEQTKNLINFAVRLPAANAKSITTDGKVTLGHGDPNLSRFGVSVSAGLVTVPARQLPAPGVRYKNLAGKDFIVEPRDGSWNMRDIKFHTGSSIDPWTYLHIRSNRSGHRDIFDDQDLLSYTVKEFVKFLNRSGIKAAPPIRGPSGYFPALTMVDGDDYANDRQVRHLFTAMSQASAAARPKFVLVILPYNETAIYNSIKTAADTGSGIHTICVVGSKFGKEQGQPQYFGNISLKFNLKAGGINQTVDPKKLGIISEGKTMVVGIDVTHPSPGSKDDAPSVAAIVASVNHTLGQWPSDFKSQEGRKEMVAALEMMFLGRLTMWQKHNKNLPENILIYRDGVSEGQYQILLDTELPLIRRACAQKYPANQTKAGFPKISIVVCGKRHNTRFYPTTEQNADKNSNCRNGTVVDRGITEVRAWDFFLQAHTSLKGTARPCHYYVVLDEIFAGRSVKPPHKNNADALEDLTHNMCYLFGRATKGVSLCPPAYYADVLCTRTRCYMSEYFDPVESSSAPSVSSTGTSQVSMHNIQVHEAIKDSMYYI